MCHFSGASHRRSQHEKCLDLQPHPGDEPHRVYGDQQQRRQGGEAEDLLSEHDDRSTELAVGFGRVRGRVRIFGG